MTGAFAALFWIVLVVYALAVGAQIFGQIFRRPQWTSRAQIAVAVGLALHTGVVAWRWIETGHVPTIGNFENALVGGWFIVAMSLWAGREQRFPLLSAASLPFALIILGGGAMSDTGAQPMLASLQSFWLYIHIFFAWLAYGAYTVACGAAILYLVRSRPAGGDAQGAATGGEGVQGAATDGEDVQGAATGGEGLQGAAADADVPDGGPPAASGGAPSQTAGGAAVQPAMEKGAALERLDELMYRSTIFGFVTDAVMIAAGSIWAKRLWGAYWSWDPVETWSLLSWLTYGVALHLRVTMGWRGRRLAWVLAFAIVGVLVSFWGVNLIMDSSAHVFNVG